LGVVKKQEGVSVNAGLTFEVTVSRGTGRGGGEKIKVPISWEGGGEGGKELHSTRHLVNRCLSKEKERKGGRINDLVSKILSLCAQRRMTIKGQ